MPKVKFGVSAEEAAAAKGGAREAPKQGLYAAKVLSIDWEEPNNKDPRFHVIFELVKTKDPLVGGYQIHTYLKPDAEASQWKWHQFLMAIGAISEKGGKGTLNTDRPQDLPTVLLRTKNEEYEGVMRAKESGILVHKPPEGGTVDDDDEEEDDEDLEEDEEVDLSEMSPDELRAYAKENDIDLPKGKVAKSKLIKLIEEGLEEDEDEDEDEEDEEDEDDEEEAEDYSEWSLPELKKELKSRSLSTAGPKTKLIARLEESDASDPFDDEE